MKCSESWLREWVNPTLNREELCQTLTMAGFEVEEVVPVAKMFTDIVIGQVRSVNDHPGADRLHLCEVDVGALTLLHIVCGAKNVRVGMKAPVAMVGALMPDKTMIKLTSIRGVTSEGMLCSAGELGLSEESEGLLVLPDEASIGSNLRDYLKLDDYIIDISITPNRGDCLSMRGMTREIAALTQTPMQDMPLVAMPVSSSQRLPVTVETTSGCPRYVGRIINKVNAAAITPIWLKERLKRSGMCSISPIVDITNYVMLELGQPMHAFDLNHIEKEIRIRLSKPGEKITLLNGSEKWLDRETMIIADDKNPLAIAGVMGGLHSGVTLLTQDIFLESAYFSPQAIARQRQQYALDSESAYRFERGVDPIIQRQAIERATQLILDIAGGEAGEITEIVHSDFLPKKRVIALSAKKVMDVLGVPISDDRIEAIFDSLQFDWQHKEHHWLVHVPAYRFDINLPEDLIEEIARLYGYDKIPTHQITATIQINQHEDGEGFSRLRQALCDQSYHEIITYSFIEEQLQKWLDPDETPRKLLNPITTEMTVMRTNLWPGLLNTLLYNKSRQQHRIRLFEMGACFITQDHQVVEKQKLGGLMTGWVAPEQWGIPLRETDFFDLKGNLENLLSLYFRTGITFKHDHHAALHPGQTAAIYHQEVRLGIFGALHPLILQKLNLPKNVFVFELDLNLFKADEIERLIDVPKFPEVRRDIAVLINQAIPAKEIQDTIKISAGDWLKDVFIFDVYKEKGISPGLKSVALALILQHPTRTLVDEEVTQLMERVIETLMNRLGAELRR